MTPGPPFDGSGPARLPPLPGSFEALLHEYLLRVGRRGPQLLGTLRRSHTTGMKSKVHPTYKAKYRVANWPAYNQALV